MVICEEEYIKCWYCQTSNVAAERDECRECGADLIAPTAEERRWQCVSDAMEVFKEHLKNRTEEEKRAGEPLMRSIAAYATKLPDTDPFKHFFFKAYPEYEE